MLRAIPRSLWVIGLLSALRLLIWKVGAAPSGPLGSDPALWGLAALDIHAGNSPLVVPLYPWLIQLLPGALIQTGLGISLVAAWILPMAAWWAARHVSPRAALLSGLGVLLLPDGIVMAFQLQPDALTSLWAIVLAGSLLRRRWALIVPLALAGLFLREHGAPVFLLVLAAALFSSGPRVPRTAALLAGAMILPPVFGGTVGLDQSWTERSETAVSLLTTDQKPPHLRMEEWREFRERGPLMRARWHASRSLSEAPELWGWVLLAGLLMAASRRKDLLPGALPILPIFGALIVWSERRHVAIAAPILVLLVAASIEKLGTKMRRGALGICGILTAAGLVVLPAESNKQRRESAAFGPVKETAEALCDLASDSDWILSIDQRLILWCPLAQLSDPEHPEAWKAWLVAPANSVESPWKPVNKEREAAWFYRLSQEELDRPCPPSEPLPRRFLLASGPSPHPAFPRIPMPTSPAVALPFPTACP